LANTYLFVEAQILDDDDTALDGGADVGPVNLWMHSLFSDVNVNLIEKLVSPPTSFFYASVGVFTTGLFQSFAVTHSYDRT
jgi:hypothetical protein